MIFQFLLIYLLLIPSSLAKSDFLLDQNSFEHLEQLFNVHPLSNYILESYLRQQKDKIIPEQHYPTREEIKNILFHSKDPYENVTGITIDPLTYYSNAARSSDHIEDVILMVFKEYPRIILEVGAYIGSGVVHAWGKFIKEGNKQRKQQNGIVLCIDTWLGDVNMRLAPSFDSFNYQDGRPTIYQTFMGRMVAEGLQEVVYPLPFPSTVAARYLSLLNWEIDVIYVDSAHETGETLVEMIMYYQLLRPGGLLMGDDYHSFPAVKRDVDTFCHFKGLTLFLFDQQWVVMKPDPQGIESGLYGESLSTNQYMRNVLLRG